MQIITDVICWSNVSGDMWHSVEIFEFAETLSMWVSVCELWHIKKTNKLRNKKKKTHKKVHFIHRPYRKINCIVCGDLLNAIEKWALAVKSRHWLEEAARDAGNKRDYVLWSTKTVKKKKKKLVLFFISFFTEMATDNVWMVSRRNAVEWVSIMHRTLSDDTVHAFSMNTKMPLVTFTDINKT